ncbi:MAG: endopeptidase La [Firmicutes bacterium]|nr:endopeptidase La [Bacillota bacterium]
MERKRVISRLREQAPGPGDWRIMPMMPLRGVLVFPTAITHLDVGRDRSINAIEYAMSGEDNQIFLTMQRDAQVDDPQLEDVYEIGTIARIRQMMKLPGGTVRLMVEGVCRARLCGSLQEEPFFLAEVEPLREESGADGTELAAYTRLLRSGFEEYAKSSKRIGPDVVATVTNIEAPAQLADAVASNLELSSDDRQGLLETTNVARRIEQLIGLLERETEIMEIEQIIANRTRQQMEKSQKDYYLREQMRAIQTELGDGEDRTSEVEEYRRKAEEAHLPDYAMERVEQELKRLEKMPAMVAEAMVITNYLDTILALPWDKKSEENLDIVKAEKILEQDHYGLKKPKERILEYLAACQLKHNLRGPILCLVGPPGVGKTSLGRSIARATGREFVRLSLGGVRDEAEIRGHRRTYIGAMPGRIIASLHQAGVVNPLFLLDEVDKLASDWRGDPTSALLEALDPEQNSTFSDHYLEIPYDLSNVMFITTANVQSNIPQPLQDRMEIIDISSYTEDEKLAIAKRHLIPKQLTEHGISKEQLRISEGALKKIIRLYTREAGVRELERRIAKICHRTGRDIVSGKEGPFRVGERNLTYYLGVPRYLPDSLSKAPKLGVANGLAWTEIGGEMLQIEAQTFPGKGKFTITGQLGDVMKESVQAAYTYLRTKADKYGIPADVDEKLDIHVHAPEGAVPKDGPSAGVTITTALASQFSGRKVRGDIAMTGEIDLHGNVLPVGGIKEKLLAAWRNGIRVIILPKECAKDLEELPDNIRSQMELHLVTQVEEVLDLALEPAVEKKDA